MTNDEKLECLEKAFKSLWILYVAEKETFDVLAKSDELDSDDLCEMLEPPMFSIEIQKVLNNEENNKKICESVKYLHSLIEQQIEIDELVFLLQINYDAIFKALKECGMKIKELE